MSNADPTQNQTPIPPTGGFSAGGDDSEMLAALGILPTGGAAGDEKKSAAGDFEKVSPQKNFPAQKSEPAPVFSEKSSTENPVAEPKKSPAPTENPAEPAVEKPKKVFQNVPAGAENRTAAPAEVFEKKSTDLAAATGGAGQISPLVRHGGLGRNDGGGEEKSADPRGDVRTPADQNSPAPAGNFLPAVAREKSPAPAPIPAEKISPAGTESRDFDQKNPAATPAKPAAKIPAAAPEISQKIGADRPTPAANLSQNLAPATEKSAESRGAAPSSADQNSPARPANFSQKIAPAAPQKSSPARDPVVDFDAALRDAKNLILGAKNILVTTAERPDGDGIGAALGFTLALRGLGKNATPALGGALPEAFRALPGAEKIEENFTPSRETRIRLPAELTRGASLRYEKNPAGELEIILTPAAGKKITPADLAVSGSAGGEIDLVVVLDTPTRGHLGDFWRQNAEFFRSVPVLVVDHHPRTEPFGTALLADPAAVESVAVPTLRLVRALEADSGKTLLTPDAATDFFFALASDTGNFQNANATARAHRIAAELLRAGADFDKISWQIFRRRPAAEMILRGRVLGRAVADPGLGLILSRVEDADYLAAGTSAEKTSGIKSSVAGELAAAANLAIVFGPGGDAAGEFTASVRTRPGARATARAVAEFFGGGGHEMAAGFRIQAADLDAAETKIRVGVAEILGRKN